MLKLLWSLIVLFPLCVVAQNSPIPDDGMNGFGQALQINTQLHSYVGKPRWIIVIRDLDHNQNIPYVYDFSSGNNVWMAYTFSKNYLVVSSTLKISTYSSSMNGYHTYEIPNFCHLESQGRIQRNKSIYVRLSGNLTPNTNTYSCHLTPVEGNIIVSDTNGNGENHVDE